MALKMQQNRLPSLVLLPNFFKTFKMAEVRPGEPISVVYFKKQAVAEDRLTHSNFGHPQNSKKIF